MMRVNISDCKDDDDGNKSHMINFHKEMSEKLKPMTQSSRRHTMTVDIQPDFKDLFKELGIDD